MKIKLLVYIRANLEQKGLFEVPEVRSIHVGNHGNQCQWKMNQLISI